jgi:hypothetical protein
MPRRRRCVLPGVACHITQRGVDRRETFSIDEDRFTYLRLVRENLDDGCSVDGNQIAHFRLSPFPRGGETKFVHATGIDVLAPAVDNLHGMVKASLAGKGGIRFP